MRMSKLREIAKCLIFIKNVKKKDLAKHIGISVVSVSNFLNGKKMKLEHLEKLFDFFNIKLGDALLFTEKNYIDRQHLIEAINQFWRNYYE